MNCVARVAIRICHSGAHDALRSTTGDPLPSSNFSHTGDVAGVICDGGELRAKLGRLFIPGDAGGIDGLAGELAGVGQRRAVLSAGPLENLGHVARVVGLVVSNGGVEGFLRDRDIDAKGNGRRARVGRRG